MTLNPMINKLEKKDILNLKHSVFPYTKKYKKLRNKVHLQSAICKNDSDWWSFKDEDYFLIRHILYLILTEATIARKTKINNINIDELYSFLTLTDEEEKLKIYLKRIN